MISLIISFLVLIVGYIIYGRITAKIFGPDGRETPAITLNDGVDYVPMKPWKAFLIQLLNIAGTGPIFGALMGAQFGPVVFLWIVFGSILGGAVHDYMSGMISSRHEGKSIAELSGLYLGNNIKYIMRIFAILLLVLVGTVFVTSPAALLAKLTPEKMGTNFWIVVILIYYILAAILPIDKIIGKLYPIFGAVLITMAMGIFVCILFSDKYTIPEITFSNMHPDNQNIWPYMFVTVACGAVSGFHATQTPMVAKCIDSEKNGRKIFYGAMISEAVIALVWAAAGVAFYGTTEMLKNALNTYGQAGVVYEISFGMMKKIGGILAIIGVVVCPVTSGDTAFRGARLILAEWFGMEQKSLKKRIILTVPLLAVGALLTKLNFEVLWRYFSWTNQTLAMISLWISTSYLMKKCKYRNGSLITAIPASFMSAVSVTYILMAEEGFKLSSTVAYPAGIAAAIIMFGFYLYFLLRRRKKNTV